MVGIYTLKAWSFQTGPRLSGKPGISGVKSGDSAPPDSELKIFQGIWFGVDLDDYICNICELEMIQQFRLAKSQAMETIVQVLNFNKIQIFWKKNQAIIFQIFFISNS
jgi:hypothetical protein